jgi:hypothetical protein
MRRVPACQCPKTRGKTPRKKTPEKKRQNKLSAQFAEEYYVEVLTMKLEARGKCAAKKRGLISRSHRDKLLALHSCHEKCFQPLIVPLSDPGFIKALN